MRDPLSLQNRMEVPASTLTPRQREVAELVDAYTRVAQEPPSYGFLARRLSISRERARQHLEALRRKGWCTP